MSKIMLWNVEILLSQQQISNNRFVLHFCYVKYIFLFFTGNFFRKIFPTESSKRLLLNLPIFHLWGLPNEINHKLTKRKIIIFLEFLFHTKYFVEFAPYKHPHHNSDVHLNDPKLRNCINYNKIANISELAWVQFLSFFGQK